MQMHKDPILSQVLQGLISGRHAILSYDVCKPYQRMWLELSVEQNGLLKGTRVVIPKALRERVL